MEKFVSLLKKIKKENECGYTMLDFLFSFALFLLFVSFLPMLLKLLAIEQSKVPYDVELFFEHIGKEIVEAKDLTASGTTLMLTMSDSREISFEKYKHDIRRRVNGAGNEILLQGVEDVSYQLVRNGVVVSLRLADSTIEKRLSLAPV